MQIKVYVFSCNVVVAYLVYLVYSVYLVYFDIIYCEHREDYATFNCLF